MRRRPLERGVDRLDANARGETRGFVPEPTATDEAGDGGRPGHDPRIDLGREEEARGIDAAGVREGLLDPGDRRRVARRRQVGMRIGKPVDPERVEGREDDAAPGPHRVLDEIREPRSRRL